MIANKEGSDIGYAIDIVSLKEIWQEVPSKLFDNTPFEAPRKEEPKEVIEPLSGTKEALVDETVLTSKNSSSSMKYIIMLLLVIALGIGTYFILKPSPEKTPHPSPRPVTDVAKVEKMAFTALIEKDYKKASKLFNQAYKLNPKYHNLYEINRLLQKNAHRMHEPIIRNMVLRRITKDLSWGAPKGTIATLKRQIRN